MEDVADIEDYVIGASSNERIFDFVIGGRIIVVVAGVGEKRWIEEKQKR